MMSDSVKLIINKYLIKFPNEKERLSLLLDYLDEVDSKKMIDLQQFLHTIVLKR